MWEWVVSVGLVILISTLISLLVPDGRLTGIVGVVLSLTVVFTLVKPLEKKDFNFKIPSINTSVEIDYSYAEHSNYLKSNYYSKQCVNLLKKEGIDNAEIDIDYQVDEFRLFKINFVRVFLSKEVINSDGEHIDIIDKVKMLISNNLNIEKDMILVFEK